MAGRGRVRAPGGSNGNLYADRKKRARRRHPSSRGSRMRREAIRNFYSSRIFRRRY